MNLWALLAVCFVASSTVGQTSETIDLFWNLYSAVVTGSRILHDVTEGVGAVSKAISAIDRLLDLTPDEKIDKTDVDIATEAEEDKKEINSVDTTVLADSPTMFNECGALGFHIRDENLPVGKMTQCCVIHDECYGVSCKASKRDCDSKLRACLFSKCDNKTMDKALSKICISAAKLLFSGKMALSFQEFKNAQLRQFCTIGEKSEKWKTKQ